MIASTHRSTRAIVNLGAIRRNIEKFYQYTKVPARTVWAVVKANGYGHGAVGVSKAIEDLVGGFCVSNLDEALELRENGLTQEILVLSGIPAEYAPLALEEKITLTAPSLAWLQQLPTGLKGLKLHIKADTGMGRIGVRDAAEANQMIDFMEAQILDFDGIFTHFAAADQADTRHYEGQVANFAKIVAGLKRRPKYVHSTNSSAGIWHPEQIGDIERYGGALYGLDPSCGELPLPFPLEYALRLESELTHVKEIQKGDTVGYGATWTATEPTIVGTVCVGYADGLSRVDMQGAHVLVDGQFCEIIGRVSMDQITIKLAKFYPLGQKVTLIGKDGKNEIVGQDWADRHHTIEDEVYCALSDRVPRVYVND